MELGKAKLNKRGRQGREDVIDWIRKEEGDELDGKRDENGRGEAECFYRE